MNYKRRIEHLCSEFKEAGLLICSPSNIFYLFGISFAQDALCLLRRNNSPIVFTDARYEIEAMNELNGLAQVIIARNSSIMKEVISIIEKDKGSFYVEGSMNLSAYETLKSAKRVKLKYNSKLDRALYTMRSIKDQEELNLMRFNFKLHRTALKEWGKRAIGLSEKKAALLWNDVVVSLGADSIAFDTIVAVGQGSAEPHHKPSRSIVNPENKLILLDCGLKKHGYNTDLTRIFSQSYTRKVMKTVELVREAQVIAASLARPGIMALDLDKAVRDFFEKNKVSRFFKHSLGHGIGIDVHEGPFIGPNSKDVLEEGMVFTIEPGIYYKGQFGIRVEDVFMVVKNGVARISYC